MFVDIVRNSLGARASVVLKSLEEAIFEHCLRLYFPTTNNEAEYEAFIAGLRSSNKLNVPKLHIFNDSKLIVNQVTCKFEAWGAKMAKYLVVAKNLLTEFRIVKIEQVRKVLHSHADTPVGLATVCEGKIGWTIAVDLILAPNYEVPQEFILVNTEVGLSWMDPIIFFCMISYQKTRGRYTNSK